MIGLTVSVPLTSYGGVDVEIAIDIVYNAFGRENLRYRQ